MKKKEKENIKSKKKLIILLVSVLVIAVTAVLLVKNLFGNTDLKATIVNVTDAKELIKDYVIEWDSSTKEHVKPMVNENAKCSISINNNVYNYEDIVEGWIDANTKYKDQGSLVFTLYTDWVAEDGVFGTDSNNDYFGNTGSVKIWGWESDITIDLNGYKIDRNLNYTTVENGETLCIDNSRNVYIKNGCITGGADNGDGGGVWIKGNDTIGCFENMTITGNVSGTKGGGIYISQKIAQVRFTDTTVEGNYALDCGAGVFVDYTKLWTDGIYGTIDLYGKIIINNNVAGDSTRRNLTFRNYTKTINQTSKMDDVDLDPESCIYVSYSAKETKAKSLTWTHFFNHDMMQYFHVDDENSELVLELLYPRTNERGYYFCLRQKSN